jgi:hypothetical protein
MDQLTTPLTIVEDLIVDNEPAIKVIDRYGKEGIYLCSFFNYLKETIPSNLIIDKRKK